MLLYIYRFKCSKAKSWWMGFHDGDDDDDDDGDDDDDDDDDEV